MVDTNILVYFLIDGDHTAKARQLHRRDSDWRSETFILVEFCNVLLRYMEIRGMKLEMTRGFLANAEMILDAKLTRISHRRGLDVAARYRVTAYDARFLALADQLGVPLVTEDAKLRTAAPALTQSLADALASV